MNISIILCQFLGSTAIQIQFQKNNNFYSATLHYLLRVIGLVDTEVS